MLCNTGSEEDESSFPLLLHYRFSQHSNSNAEFQYYYQDYTTACLGSLWGWASQRSSGLDYELSFWDKFQFASGISGISSLDFCGVVIGAMAATIQQKELKLTVGPVKDPVFAFILGFLVINFGLIWGLAQSGQYLC